MDSGELEEMREALEDLKAVERVERNLAQTKDADAPVFLLPGHGSSTNAIAQASQEDYDEIARRVRERGDKTFAESLAEAIWPEGSPDLWYADDKPPAHRKFESGAIRDVTEGKGRYDLLSPVAIRRLCKTLQEGGKKYGDRNWEAGMPLSSLLDSCLRHVFQLLDGQTDEDHAAHAMSNLMFFMHIQDGLDRGMYSCSLDDLPNSTNL